MKPNNRITYRFDNNGRSEAASEQNGESAFTAPAAEPARPKAAGKVVSLRPSEDTMIFQELNPWHSPFQEDIGALEELIRSTDNDEGRKPAKREELAVQAIIDENKQGVAYEDPFASLHEIPMPEKEYIKHSLQERFPDRAEYGDELDLDESANYRASNSVLDDRSTHSSSYTTRIRKSSGPSWLNVFLSVSGALLTGAVFGYILLSLFSGTPIIPEQGNVSVPAIGGQITSAPDNSGAKDNGQPAPPAGEDSGEAAPFASLAGLDRTYYFVQYGVFSNTEGRDLAIEQLKQKRVASAAMRTINDYRVYAGMAVDRSKAAVIIAKLPDMDLYVKEIAIKAPDKLPFGGDSETAQTFFEQTAELVEVLDKLAITQLEQSSLSAINEAAAQAWKQQHQRWTESAAAMQKGIGGDDGKEKLDTLTQAINTAAKSMTEYDKKPSDALLWATQSSLMEAVIAQKEWFETISAL